MSVTFIPIDVRQGDRAEFIRFMTRNNFPFHVNALPEPEQVEGWIEAGRYDGPDNAALWLDDDEYSRVGLVVLEDMAEGSPLFDLRLGNRYRGIGIGQQVLGELTAHVFATMPEVTRLEGQTREDNTAMRTLFARLGYVKEAHYRESWPVPDGEPLASIAYAMLRRDWISGTTTSLVWDDFPPAVALPEPVD